MRVERSVSTVLFLMSLLVSYDATAQAGPPSVEETARTGIESVQQFVKYRQEADGLLTATTVSLLRNLPVQHPETGDVVPFNELCRDVLNQVGNGALRGSDLARDPVETVVLLMLDTDHFLRARLIKVGRNEWISLAEMGRREMGRTSLELLARYDAMQRAYRQGQPNALASSILSFYKAVREVNARSGGVERRLRKHAPAGSAAHGREKDRTTSSEASNSQSVVEDAHDAGAEVVQISGGTVEVRGLERGRFRVGARVKVVNTSGEAIAQGVVTSAVRDQATVELQTVVGAADPAARFRVVPLH